MKIKIIKSSQAIVKIPRVVTITPGPNSQGYITNIEGLVDRVIASIKASIEDEDDKSIRKRGKNLIKKLTKAKWGQEQLKIIIEDKYGNSAILSDKAEKVKLGKGVS
jgi:zinc finger protein